MMWSFQVGGLYLTRYLSTLLAQNNGHSFTSHTDMEHVREMKERFCYLTPNSKEEQEKYYLKCSPNDNFPCKTYTLPDSGEVITLGAEQYQCPEALFDPTLCGARPGGLHEIIATSINMIDEDIRKEVYYNIVLSGGCSMLQGLKERLNEEVVRLSPAGTVVRMVAQPDRKDAVWVGASILASLRTFKEQWVTREEYEEHGGAIIHQRLGP